MSKHLPLVLQVHFHGSFSDGIRFPLVLPPALHHGSLQSGLIRLIIIRKRITVSKKKDFEFIHYHDCRVVVSCKSEESEEELWFSYRKSMKIWQNSQGRNFSSKSDRICNIFTKVKVGIWRSMKIV